jgi:MSHA pilin protein MshD
MFISACFRQRGLSLIELVMFMVIVAVGIAGIAGVLNVTTQKSADPVASKQALAIAEALLEEIQLAPFTFCDPDDVQATTATSSTACADPNLREDTLPLKAEAGDARPFDNVSDYNGFSMTGIRDLAGASIAGLDSYAASVVVAPAALGSVSAGDALRIAVSVTGPGNTQVVVEGFRTRYAPNAVP